MKLRAYSVFAGLLLAQASARVVDELKDQRSLIQVRVVRPEELTVAGAVQASKAFLAEGVQRKLNVLTMYADSAAAAEQVAFCENSYKQWKSLYENFPKTQFRAAQLISTGDGSVVAVRSADGAISRQLLRGIDPTKFELNGAAFEILFATGRTRSKFEKCEAGAIEPVLYVKTTAALTAELCEKNTERLSQKLGASHLRASFRNDIWFLCSQFPVFYPFAPPGQIPTEATQRMGAEFTCSMGCDGVPKCVLTSGTLPGKGRLDHQ